MELTNKKRTKKIKLVFNLIVVVFIAIALYFLWKREDLYLLYTGVGLAVYIALTLLMGFNYIFFSSEGNKVVLRYYPVIALFGREYNTVEFSQKALHKYELNKNFFLKGLILIVKTKRGIADYPSISLTALSKTEINSIQGELESILDKRQ